MNATRLIERAVHNHRFGRRLAIIRIRVGRVVIEHHHDFVQLRVPHCCLNFEQGRGAHWACLVRMRVDGTRAAEAEEFRNHRRAYLWAFFDDRRNNLCVLTANLTERRQLSVTKYIRRVCAEQFEVRD